jgi:hypothetical protein
LELQGCECENVCECEREVSGTFRLPFSHSIPLYAAVELEEAGDQ